MQLANNGPVGGQKCVRAPNLDRGAPLWPWVFVRRGLALDTDAPARPRSCPCAARLACLRRHNWRPIEITTSRGPDMHAPCPRRASFAAIDTIQIHSHTLARRSHLARGRARSSPRAAQLINASCIECSRPTANPRAEHECQLWKLGCLHAAATAHPNQLPNFG